MNQGKKLTWTCVRAFFSMMRFTPKRRCNISMAHFRLTSGLQVADARPARWRAMATER